MATRIKSNQISDNSIVAADLHSAITVNTTSSGTFGSVIVDDITLDGSSLVTSGTNNFTVDSGGLIILDADSNGDIRLANSAGQYAALYNSGDHLYVKSIINEGDVYLSGKDSNGAHINALRLNMGNGGHATFNEGIIAGGDVSINSTGGSPLAVHGAISGDVYVQVVNTQAASTNNQSSVELRANSSTQERQTVKITGDFTDITDASRDSRLRFYTFANGTQVIPLTLNQLDAAFAGDVVITGDLTVEGSQVTLNTTALDVEDKNITLNYHASNDTSASADGAGITIQDAVDASTDATILWDATSDKFDFSHTVNIAGDGKLGIGVSNPTSTIDLTRTSDTGERAIRIENSSARVYVGVEGSSGNRFVGSAVDNAFIGTTTADGLELATNNNVRMVIDTAGKVGIGDTSPSVILEANGQISSHVGGGGATYTTGILEINSGSTPTQVKITTPIKYEGDGSYTHAHTVTIKGFQYGGLNTVDLKISWHVYLNQFYNRTCSSSGGWAPVITLGVENNYVVIHLTGPQYWPKMYVESHYTPYGGAALSTGWSWSDAAISNDSGKPEQVVSYKINFGNSFLMDSNGNIGIGGDTIPDSKLDINSASTAAGSNFGTKSIISRLPLTSGYQTQIASAHAIHDSSIYAADIGYKYRNQGYDLTFSTNNNTTGDPTQHMVIDKIGNVGIGTDNPGTDLHVNSTADTQIIVSADNSMALHQDSAWNSNLYFGAYHDGATAVYGKTGRGAFRMVNLHDGDSSPQYISLYGANAGTKGDTITWNTVGLAMDEDGNVGIGTTDPQALLEISKTTAGLISGGTGNKGATIRLHHEAQWEGGYGNAPTNPDFLGSIDFSTGDSSSGEGIKASIRTSVESYYNTNHLNFYTADGSGSTSMVERLSIQQNGRIVLNRGTTDYEPTHSGVVKNHFTVHTDYNTQGTQHVSLSNLNGNWLDGTTGPDSQYGMLFGYNNQTRGGIIYDHRSTEMMTMWSSYAPIRFMVPDAADGDGVPTDTNINTALTLEKSGKVGVRTESPKAEFHVDTGGGSDGFAVGGKNVSLNTSFQTGAQLEITLGDHQACYVKVFLTGDWSGHSAMAFLGEYFIQNGANQYAEAGQIIREVDNTHGIDYVSSQIYDGGAYDSFQIQFKLNVPSGASVQTASGNITYQVMGQFDAIT